MIWKNTGKGIPMINKRDVFIKGKNIYLKVLTKEDVLSSGWYGWFNDEYICESLQKHYFPNTVENQLAYWEQLALGSDKEKKIQLGICKNGSSKLLGIVSLQNIDTINRKAEISAVVGEKAGRDTKTIAEAWKLIFWHGFNVLNLNRIYGGSISKPVVDLMCRVAACTLEGIRKQDVFKNGSYIDTYEYGVLRSEFNEKYFKLPRSK